MKPATVAPRPRPKLPATRRSAVDAARCSAGTKVKVRTWPAVPTNPKPAPPTAEQTKPCQGRWTNAKPVADRVHKIAHDHDPRRTETIEQRPRRERDHGRRGHDCRQHEPRGRRREAPDGVEV